MRFFFLLCIFLLLVRWPHPSALEVLQRSERTARSKAQESRGCPNLLLLL